MREESVLQEIEEQAAQMRQSAGVIPEKTGILICGHGSRDQRAVDEFAHIASVMQKRFPDVAVVYGYLEFATPIIRTALDELKAKGITHVLASPGTQE